MEGLQRVITQRNYQELILGVGITHMFEVWFHSHKWMEIVCGL